MKKKKTAQAKKVTVQPVEDCKDEYAGLLELGEDEMEQAWHSAVSAERVHEPLWLRSQWETRLNGARAEGVAELVRIMRKGAALSDLDDPGKATHCLAWLIHLVVQRFERLAAGGVLDDVLSEINALPVLYSTAGNGSPKWTWACELFKGKQVGTRARYLHGRCDASAIRRRPWRALAEDAVEVALSTAVRISKFDKLRAGAVAYRRFNYRRPRARYSVIGTFYLLNDGSVLLWPDWLEKCRGLPQQVKADVERFKVACLAMAQEFFGDTHNKHAEELLAPLQAKVRDHGQTAGRARMEAALMVAAAVGRLGGEK